MRVLIFVLSIMLPLAIPEAKAVSSDSRSYGGTLNWGTRNKPTIINPLLTTSSVSMSLLDLIFNRLVRLNPKGEIEPDLAERWEISADGMVYTFYLRNGVRFHDGAECTAEDVKFTYDKIVQEESESPFKAHFNLVKDFKVIDKYTFQITLKKPSVSFMYRLVREIVPKHILEGADLESSSFNFHPIGTGPFRFKEWTEGDTIILEYNPDYYEGRPYLDRIVIKTYPDSRDAWIALMRGEVDYVELIEREDYEIIKKDPSFNTYDFPIDCYYAISYDLDDRILSDEKIRQAVAYGIDREAIIERAAYGYGLESAGPFYPGSIGYNPDVRPFGYDPEKSMGLLNQAGWNDIDNDGILEKEGEELEIRVLVDSRSDIYKRIIMAVRQELQKIGIKIKVVSYDNESMLTVEFLRQNRPQAFLKLFLATDFLTISEYWSSKESPRVNKLWVYKNSEVDRLFESGEVMQNDNKRRLIYQDIHKIIYEDQPACFLYCPYQFHALSNRLEGADELFSLSMPYYTIKNWIIK